jgi:hypothetical protein
MRAQGHACTECMPPRLLDQRRRSCVRLRGVGDLARNSHSVSGLSDKSVGVEVQLDAIRS